jgi:hypothetical protein
MQDPERIYVELGRLVETTPDLENDAESDETMQWLGRAYALVARSGSTPDSAAFRAAMDAVATEVDGRKAHAAVQTVRSIIYRRLAIAEMEAPQGVRGAFIPAGNSFDAIDRGWESARTGQKIRSNY